MTMTALEIETPTRNGGLRGFLIDFRDEFGYSAVDCAVCGSPADAWDARDGVIFHSPSSYAFVDRKAPCSLREGL